MIRPLVANFRDGLAARIALAQGLTIGFGFILYRYSEWGLATICLSPCVGWLATKLTLASLYRAQQTIQSGEINPINANFSGLPLELRPIIHAVTDAQSRASFAIKRQQSYLSDISHELRGHLAILQARTDSALEADECEAMTGDIGRLTRLLDQSLIIARLRTGEVPLTDCDLVSMVRAIAISYVPHVGARHCSLTFVDKVKTLLVKINCASVEMALRNLIENAIDHARDGSAIEIFAREGGIIEIINEGSFIEAANRIKIFEPFWPGRDRRKGGAGLGLAVVKETATTHKGNVWIESRDQGRISFVLQLPLIGAAPTIEEVRLSSSTLGNESATLPFNRPIAITKWCPSVSAAQRNHLDAAHLATIVETSADAISSRTLNGVIISWNPAAERIFGYTAEEMVGQIPHALSSEDCSRHQEIVLPRILAGSEVEEFETTKYHKSGASISVLMSIVPLKDHNGKIIGTSHVVRDITKQRQTEKILREKLILLTAITDHAAEGMILADRHGRATFINPAAEKMSGWKSEDLLGKSIHDTLHYKHPDGEAFAWCDCPLSAVYRDAAVITDYEHVLIRADATPLEVAYSNAPIVVDGIVSGSVLIIHDISARRRAESTLKEALKLEAMSNLTGGLAHDFNNLLGVIIGNLDDLLASPHICASVTLLGRDALAAALHGSDLVASLLSFARRQPLQPKWLEPNKAVIKSISILSRTLGGQVLVQTDLGNNVWPIMADMAQLEAALMNLAANARDAMKRNGKVIIRTKNLVLNNSDLDHSAGDYVAVEVQDTGEGIPNTIRPKIFEPFFTTKEQGKGTGLGLSMVFGFVHQSGGHIEVISPKEGGTCFSLRFPRAMSPRIEPENVRQPSIHGDGETVLVVEDNNALRHLVCRQIRDLGYLTLEAETVNDALKILNACENDGRRIATLFTDIVMPGEKNGIDLVLEASERWPEIKLVLTSGYENIISDAAKHEVENVAVILSKPYRKNELSAVLNLNLIENLSIGKLR